MHDEPVVEAMAKKTAGEQPTFSKSWSAKGVEQYHADPLNGWPWSITSMIRRLPSWIRSTDRWNRKWYCIASWVSVGCGSYFYLMSANRTLASCNLLMRDLTVRRLREKDSAPPMGGRDGLSNAENGLGFMMGFHLKTSWSTNCGISLLSARCTPHLLSFTNSPRLPTTSSPAILHPPALD